jgi:hypothetical protein
MPSLTAPYFEVPSGEDALRVEIPKLRRPVEKTAEHDAIIDSLLNASGSWLDAKLRRIGSPGLLLNLGLPAGSSLLHGNMLHLYAISLSDRIKEIAGVQFSCVRLSKRHGDTTALSITEAVVAKRPPAAGTVTLLTRRSYSTPAFANEVSTATESIRNLNAVNKPIRLHLSYVTGLPRTWSRLWGPTMSGIFPHEPQNPQLSAAQIVELGFDHKSVGEQLEHSVQLTVSTYPTGLSA